MAQSMSLITIFIAHFLICAAAAAIPVCEFASPTTAPAPVDDSQQPAVSPEANVPAPDQVPEAESPILEPEHQGIVFDVTGYGAVADGKKDSSEAFLAAWEDACDHNGDSTVFIPEGTFFVRPIRFSGPCYNNQSPKVEIRGTLQAPKNLDEFPKSYWIMFQDLHGINLTGGNEMGTLDGQGAQAWTYACHDYRKSSCQNFPRILQFANVANGTISNIALLNSKGFHAAILDSQNIDIHGVNITAPWDSPNTDGIHIGSSTNINITSSTIGVGDDCVSIGPGSINISVSNITCGPGHGISIGSLGKYADEADVMGVTVRNCTIKGTQNGVRIKTWPGSRPSKASNLTFEDIVMVNVSNPIIIDQDYCPHGSCKTLQPSQVKLCDILFKNIRGTSNTKPAVNLQCSKAVPCENLQLRDVKLNYTTSDGSGSAGLSMNGGLHNVDFLGFNF